MTSNTPTANHRDRVTLLGNDAISSALLAALLLFVGGCTESVYTLGTWGGAGVKQNSCREDGSTLTCPEAGTRPLPEDAGDLSDAAPIPDPEDATSRMDGGERTDACVEQRRTATRRGLDAYLLVDDSPSVVLQPVWDSLKAAIGRFIDDPANAGLGLGVQFFGTSCAASDYATPVVPIQPIAVSGPLIKQKFPLPINGKALGAALTGSLSYLEAHAKSTPKRDTVLILVSDGILDLLCGSNESRAAEVIASGLASDPPVKTVVVGLGAGPTLIDPVDLVSLAPLDTLASAGGTGKAARVEVNLSTNEELTTALQNVIRVARACAYAIPDDFAPNRTSLDFAPTPNAPVVPWPRVSGEKACGTSNGAFIDPAKPGFLTLCRASCDAILSNPEGKVRVREVCDVPR